VKRYLRCNKSALKWLHFCFFFFKTKYILEHVNSVLFPRWVVIFSKVVCFSVRGHVAFPRLWQPLRLARITSQRSVCFAWLLHSFAFCKSANQHGEAPAPQLRRPGFYFCFRSPEIKEEKRSGDVGSEASTTLQAAGSALWRMRR